MTLAAFLANAASRHDFHTSLLTIEKNENDKILEITVRVFRHDLEPMLSRRLNKQIDLGAEPKLDSELLRYFNEKVRIKNASDAVLSAEWVGKEIDSKVVYMYLQIPNDGDVEGFSIENSLFFESFKEQVNYVLVKSGEKRCDLVFKNGDGKKNIELKTPEPAKDSSR